MSEMDPRVVRNFHRESVSVAQAQQLLAARIQPLGSERLPLLQAIGRVAAERIVCPEPIPHFARAGMDGYAVRSEDLTYASTNRPVKLTVIESVPCGKEPQLSIAEGQAARIMTGGMVPFGADAVVMLEASESAADGSVWFRKSIQPGTNVSAIGSDVAVGAELVARGTRIGSGPAALLAAAGIADVPVFRKPMISIVSTGSELLADLSESLQPAKIRNSNSYMLFAKLLSAGAIPVLKPCLPDDPGAIAEALAAMLQQSDAVITTGGVSVGDFDHLRDFLLEWDGELLFNKVRMRPGSVTSAGISQSGKPLFALSGNPGACAAAFELFVRPGIGKMNGAQSWSTAMIDAILAEDFLKTNAYPRYIRGSLWSEGGRLHTAPIHGDRSSSLMPGRRAGCYILFPPGGSGHWKGTVVEVLRIPDGAEEGAGW